MTKVTLCDPYFWEQPSVLAGSAWWRRWSRDRNARCASETVNEVAAVYLFTFFLSAIVSVAIEYPLGVPMALAAATLYLLPAFLSLFDLQGYRSCQDQAEGFQAPNLEALNPDGLKFVGITDMAPDAAGPATGAETRPTAANPFMNVLIDEYKYDPLRPPAAPIGSPEVADTLDAYFRVQWASDPTDVFGRTQSQRMFVAMPSTSIPNDQDSFQNWLYRIPGKTCKEGGREACLPGTDGGPVTWLNQDR